MIAPDQTTFDYIKGREFAPQGADFDRLVEEWKKLPTDDGAKFDRVEKYAGADIRPQVTWGTNPGQVMSIDGTVPRPGEFTDETEQKTTARALEYMGLKGGEKLNDVSIDRVFIRT